MSARWPSALATAYAPSERDGLPNAISTIAQVSRVAGTPSHSPEYYWAVATWWIKFGAAQFGASTAPFLDALSAEKFAFDRLDVPLPSGKVLSLPAGLSLINPLPEASPVTRAAHAIMYSVPELDLFSICFTDSEFVAEVILDFDGFIEWLGTQETKPALVDLLARYVAELIRRRPAGVDVATVETSYLTWLESSAGRIGAHGVSAASRLLRDLLHAPVAARRSHEPSVRSADIDVYGYLSHPIGIGEDARFAAQALEQAGYRVNRIVLDDINTLPPPRSPIGLWAVPAPNLAIRELGFANAHFQQRIILAAPWEFPTTPAALEWVYRGVDEICVYSSFVQQSLPAALRPRATLLPMAFNVSELEATASNTAKAPVFTFAVMFDFGSTVRRKGPHRAIAAFKAAFPRDVDVRLVVKSTHADLKPGEWQHLQDLAASDDRIRLIDAKWDAEAVRNWLAEAHVYVSLHASEGFGRVLAESMLLDTLVIATDYSGSREVCSAETALLVPFTLVELAPDDYPFGDGQVWAAPDIAAAAAAMRDAHANWNSPRLATLRNCGRALVRERFTVDHLSAALGEVVERVKKSAA
ncbi:glycosyltransferase [Mesorhizobium marinum]|uniref:glycosyltransferase n=1 Tax=Mesorhizobium marinum TaxID=3228790 RepID=UPI003465326C